MTTYNVPLKPVPSQQIVVSLAGQSATIITRQMAGKQYLSLSISGNTICVNAIIRDRTPIVRTSYTGFVGDLVMVDTEGITDPSFTGYGTRYFLIYSDTGFDYVR